MDKKEKAKFLRDWADEFDPSITPPEKIPEGYRWDGEKRLAKAMEWYIGPDGQALQAVLDHTRVSFYIIYKIEPKFKPGDIVMSGASLRFVTKDGLRWPDGDLYDNDPEQCRPSKHKDIIDYIRKRPMLTARLFHKLAEFYAKEAKQ